jgi:tetratricopeptide (TPR) repeat protein
MKRCFLAGGVCVVLLSGLAGHAGADSASERALQVFGSPIGHTEAWRACSTVSLNGPRTAAMSGPAGQVVLGRPVDLPTRLAQIRQWIARGELDRAEQELRRLAEAFPDSAPVRIQMGMVLLLRGDVAGAHASFERALEVEQDSMAALEGLVTLDIVTRQPAEALRRIEARLTRTPDDTGVLLLAARVQVATRDWAGAEATLRRVLELDAAALPAYGLLGQVYLGQRRLDEAREEFENLARKTPGSVSAHTVVAMILHAQNRQEEAREWYERILRIDPKAPVAANNLAWILAERGENLDRALELAQLARERLARPEVTHTLGWIYYKKNMPNQAVEALEESVEQDPQNSVYLYHLGLAYLQADDAGNARTAFERALTLREDFPGAAEAKTLLGKLPAN